MRCAQTSHFSFLFLLPNPTQFSALASFHTIIYFGCCHSFRQLAIDFFFPPFKMLFILSFWLPSISFSRGIHFCWFFILVYTPFVLSDWTAFDYRFGSEHFASNNNRTWHFFFCSFFLCWFGLKQPVLSFLFGGARGLAIEKRVFFAIPHLASSLKQE